jgi:hypothetical protein
MRILSFELLTRKGRFVPGRGSTGSVGTVVLNHPFPFLFTAPIYCESNNYTSEIISEYICLKLVLEYFY